MTNLPAESAIPRETLTLEGLRDQLAGKVDTRAKIDAFFNEHSLDNFDFNRVEERVVETVYNRKGLVKDLDPLSLLAEEEPEIPDQIAGIKEALDKSRLRVLGVAADTIWKEGMDQLAHGFNRALGVDPADEQDDSRYREETPNPPRLYLVMDLDGEGEQAYRVTSFPVDSTREVSVIASDHSSFDDIAPDAVPDGSFDVGLFVKRSNQLIGEFITGEELAALAAFQAAE